MRRREFIHQCGRSALALSLCPVAPLLAGVAEAGAAVKARLGYVNPRPSPFFQALGGETVQCVLCPRQCVMAPGERGYCEVRENQGGRLMTLTWGNPCSLAVDPVEKKPFFHLLPGTRSFSLATAGCNFDCKFCQNWEISQVRPEESHNYEMPPEAVVEAALRYDCATIASTYVEPVIFLEYMLDIGKAARERGVLKVMHSNGYVNAEPLERLLEHLDAACVDLKGFNEDYYRDMTEGSLAPVLATLKRIRASGRHLELVTLLIPGRNDDPAEITAMSRWIIDELGPDTPLHLTRFTPRYKLKSLPPTPISTLERAWEAARKAGLNFVYIGNVPGHAAENTFCPKCGEMLIRRVGWESQVLGLADGACSSCGREIPGVWKRR